MEYTRLFSTLFSLSTGIELSKSQLIFIKSEKSANNNINRSIKFYVRSKSTSNFIIYNNNFDIYTNYTTYNFIDLIPNLNNYIYRQFSYYDSLKVRISTRFSISSENGIKLSEYGDLNWKQFKMNPKRYLEEFYFQPKLDYNIYNITLSSGLKIYNINNYIYNKSQRILNFKTNNIAPLLQTLYNYNNNLYICCKAWFEFININKPTYSKQTNFVFQAIYKLY